MTSRRYRFYDPAEPLYYIGLDLGKLQDHTALAVIEKRVENATPSYRLRALKRFPLRTDYACIVDAICKILSDARVCPNLLVVDATGVGNPVIDMFLRRDVRLLSISIHGGDKVTRDGNLRVPKRDLVSVLQILLQSGQLRIAARLPEAPLLLEELMNFTVRLSDAGRDSYGVWREGIHDDLVLAVALACWVAERGMLPSGLKRPRRSDPNRRLMKRNCPISTFSTNSQFLVNMLKQSLCR
jgi:hypothetical protein